MGARGISPHIARRWLQIELLARTGLNNTEIGERLGLHRWRVCDSRGDVRRWMADGGVTACDLDLALRRKRVRQLTREGCSTGEIAVILGIAERTVTRDRTALRLDRRAKLLVESVL